MSRFSKFSESSNPFLKEDTYRKTAEESKVLDSELVAHNEKAMTVNGAINKTLILTGIMLITTLYSFAFPNPLFIMGGALLGFIAFIYASFKPEKSPIVAPIYAALEGLVLGGISAMYAAAYGGIIFQAVTLTMAVLFMMLFIYKTKIIVVTSKFRTGVVMATGAIVLVYIVNFALSFFGMSVPFLHEGGALGIGISLVIIGVAALNLLLDFDSFEKGERYGAPQYMEWFSAMGLLVTLVWLYLEILRLLAMLSSND
ncbi:MAG: Bax inhibitor-1/YccA family protein [Bacteroidota bacterium]